MSQCLCPTFLVTLRMCCIDRPSVPESNVLCIFRSQFIWSVHPNYISSENIEDSKIHLWLTHSSLVIGIASGVVQAPFYWAGKYSFLAVYYKKKKFSFNWTSSINWTPTGPSVQTCHGGSPPVLRYRAATLAYPPWQVCTVVPISQPQVIKDSCTSLVSWSDAMNKGFPFADHSWQKVGSVRNCWHVILRHQIRPNSRRGL